MNDVSRELYIVAGGAVDLLMEQDDQPDFIESTRRAGQVSCLPTLQCQQLCAVAPVLLHLCCCSCEAVTTS